MCELPTGTVTFLFSDIEGSTRLLDELGPGRYAEVLDDHRLVMRAAFAAHGGVEVDTQGDAFFVAFPAAAAALEAAAQAQAALAEGPVRVRMGLHSGKPLVTAEGYVGMDVHQGARVMSAGHGGQVLVSEATQELLAGDGRLLDLGLHRLKDLTEPQRLWQLGAGEFPPLKTLYQTNLPVQPTPLIGRERELGEVLELLRRERLVTLTGAGGSGKTRLALQATAELTAEFRDGAWWVSLAALHDPQLVEPTIAQVVGARDDLSEHLRGKQTLLLLLDNFEQVVEAAAVVAKLLSDAPGLRVLVTSRERLAIAAEHEYLVPTLAQDEAVALFTARARQLKSDFEPDEAVAEICRRLDGLPLAIELAAARVKVLRPEEILTRLTRSLELLTAGARDAPDRHRTLRATIQWSYDLLDEGERELFARLAVFRGSFDLAAAECVADADLDTLAALVDKSLLRQRDDGRFFALETIREYAGERLAETFDAEEVRERHAEHFADLAERAEAGIQTSEQEAWLERLEADIDNLRAALHWSLAGRNPDAGFRLCTALILFCFKRDHLLEADRWLDVAVSRLAAASPPVRARVLSAAGTAATFTGQFDKAQPLVEEAIRVAREIGDRAAEAWSLEDMGILAREQGAIGMAISLIEQALGSRRELGDVYWTANTLHQLAECLRDAGEHARARRVFEEAIGLWRETGCVREEAASTHGLGDLTLDVGEVAEAERRYLESLELGKDSSEWNCLYCLAGLSAVAGARGDFERTARLWGAVEALERSIGMSLLPQERSRYERFVQQACEREPSALAEGRELDIASAIAYASRQQTPSRTGIGPPNRIATRA